MPTPSTTPRTVVVYHSGYGHTKRLAEAVTEGASASLFAIDADGNVPEEAWSALNSADAIIFLHGWAKLAVQAVCGRILQRLAPAEVEGQAFRRLQQ